MAEGGGDYLEAAPKPIRSNMYTGNCYSKPPLTSFPRKRESSDLVGLVRIGLDSRFRGNDAERGFLHIKKGFEIAFRSNVRTNRAWRGGLPWRTESHL